MITIIFLALVILLILGGAIFIAKAGIFFCEDSRMLKILLGGYLSLYLMAALLVAVALPPVGGTMVNVDSVTRPWADVAADIPISLGIPSIIKTAFGAKL